MGYSNSLSQYYLKKTINFFFIHLKLCWIFNVTLIRDVFHIRHKCRNANSSLSFFYFEQKTISERIPSILSKWENNCWTLTIEMKWSKKHKQKRKQVSFEQIWNWIRKENKSTTNCYTEIIFMVLFTFRNTYTYVGSNDYFHIDLGKQKSFEFTELINLLVTLTITTL